MDNKEFDNIIKDQLSNIDINLPKGSWGDMKSYMSKKGFETTTNKEDTEFDQSIKEQIKDFNIPFNQSHQDQFINQYREHRIARKRKIYNIISRTAIVLLLVFSSINLYDTLDFSTDNSISFNEIESIQIINNNRSDNNSTNNKSNSILVNEKHMTAQTNPIETGSIIRAKSVLSKSKINNHPLSTNIERKQKLNTFVKDPNYTLSNNNAVTSQIATNKHTTCDPLATPLFYLNESHEQRKRTMNNTTSKPKVHDIPNGSRFNIGGWVSIDNNVNFDYNNEPFTTSLSSGVSISKKIGNFEIETGMEYGHIAFNPSENDNYYGTKSNLKSMELENVDLVVSSIPIQAKYHIDIDKDMRFYTAIGSKYNTILYNNSDESITNATGLRNATSSNLSRSKPTIGGVLEGGSWIDNSYISATVGFGLERELGHNTIAYIEPSFETQIDRGSIRFTNDKYRGLNLRLGVKRRI